MQNKDIPGSLLDELQFGNLIKFGENNMKNVNL